MQTAQSLPMSVGTAPGTTTMVLAGPSGETVGCENPERAAYQRYLLYPPGKFVAGVQAAATRIKTVLDPYGSIEALRGIGRKSLRGLGIVLAPYGNRTPNPSYEMVAAMKDYGPGTYCTKRPERGPNYRWQQTSAYAPEDRNHSMNGALGAVPTDMQLASQYGYTPVVSQWIPFKQGAWSPAPWIPPTGAASGAPQNQGYMTQLAGVTAHRLGDAMDDADVVNPGNIDPTRATLNELQRHQDRMYMLGIISAAAVASTALVNVFRYSSEKRDRRRYGKTAAEPAPSISGVRRARRRRG